MVADDLVELTRPACRGPHGPIGKTLMELGSELLGDACIRRIANQGVAEPVGIFAAGVRGEQVLAGEAE